MNNSKILFIGCGNMGRVVLNSFVESEISPSNIYVKEHSESLVVELMEKYCVKNFNDYETVQIDILVLAIKPQQLNDIDFSQFTFTPKTLVISILAGTQISQIRATTDLQKIIRVMPNLPLMVGKGMSTYFASNVTEVEKNFVEKVFSRSGEVIELMSEDQIHAATLLAGSGPGFYYYFCTIFKDIALSYGFSETNAAKLAEQTLIGAAKLLDESDDSSAQLQNKVASKGGTTETSISEFERLQLLATFKQALEKGVKKSMDLSNGK